MKNSFLSLGFGVLITLAMTTFAVTSVSAASPASDVLDQINVIRTQNGVAPLVAVPELDNSAQSYASTMATGQFFSHVGLDGSTVISRDEAAGYTNWTYLEENLAAGQNSATAVVSAWMQSPAHRADILSPLVTETGVGYIYLAGSPYGYYWVQEFGSRSTPEVITPVTLARPGAGLPWQSSSQSLLKLPSRSWHRSS